MFTSLHSSGPSPGGALSHLASHCCVAGGRRASAHSRDGWPVWLEQRTARCCCPIPHCAEHSPHSPVTQRAGGQRRKLQRMVAGGLAAGGQCAGGSVARWSELLHSTTRWRRPGPQLGVHSDQSRAAHSGGQAGPWQASRTGGRGCGHALSSSAFSSAADTRRWHTTERLRTPASQLRLQRDQFPTTQSGGQGSVLQARCLLGSLLWALQWWGATAELSS